MEKNAPEYGGDDGDYPKELPWEPCGKWWKDNPNWSFLRIIVLILLPFLSSSG
jgi:hypothetical protein